MNEITNWDDVIKKEARGIDDNDLGEVHDIEANIVVIQSKVTVDTTLIYDVSIRYLSPLCSNISNQIECFQAALI